MSENERIENTKASSYSQKNIEKVDNKRRSKDHTKTQKKIRNKRISFQNIYIKKMVLARIYKVQHEVCKTWFSAYFCRSSIFLELLS